MRLGILAALVLVLSLNLVTVRAEAQSDSENIQQMFDHAVRRAQRGSLTAALEQLFEIQNLDPAWPEIPLNIGLLASRLNRHDDCMIGLQRYLALQPNGEHADEAAATLERCATHAATTGTLELQLPLDIAGLRVFLNDTPVDLTQRQIRLPSGSYRITAQAPDHERFSQPVTIQGTRTSTLNVQMTALEYFGTLKVLVNEPGASVTLDGRPLSTPEEALTLHTGRYLVQVRKDGFHPWQRYVEIHRDTDELVNVRLLPESFILP